MKLFGLLSLLFLGFLSTSIAKPTSLRKSSKCPPADTIDGCTCVVTQDQADIRCDSFQSPGGVTMLQVENLMQKLREVNNVKPDDWLDIYQIIFESEYGMSLTPFLRTRLTYWAFNSRHSLDALDFPPLNSSRGLIETPEASMFFNKYLKDENLGDFLKYFSPLELVDLSLFYNALKGTGDQGEFVPGLSGLVNLQELDLSFNRITELDGAPFLKNNKLTRLDLTVNPLEILGATAFLFDDPPANLKNETLTIVAQNVPLTEDSFHEETLAVFKRPVTLNIYGAKLTTLPESKFRAFLESNPANSMVLHDNLLKCDGRVKWLKDRKDEFEHRVIGAECINDVFETVFTSDLVV